MSTSGNSQRILYVSRIWPHKAASGGDLRSLNVLRALQQMGTVEVVILDYEKEKGDVVSDPGCEFKVAYAFEVKQLPNKGLIEKLNWTLNPRSHYPHGCCVEGEAMDRILSSLKEFDLVWFHTLRSPDVFPNICWRCSVVDIDDVPSTYERATLQIARGPREAFLARRRVFSWRRREKLLGDRFTVLAVCSEGDKQYLRRMGVQATVHVIPNGCDKPCVEPVRSPATPARIGFIGNFDHFPNYEGIHWFVNRCWPHIKCEIPDTRLRLVGAGSDGPLKPLGLDIDGLGWLKNPEDEISTWSVMVVPIRVGAGTRVKIAQGFSQKCPMVSTSLGAYGYGALDGQEIYLADSPEAFYNACVRAIREPAKATQMAERAWRQFLEKWTWDAIQPLVWAAAEDCLRLNGRSVRTIYGRERSTSKRDTPTAHPTVLVP
jgi:polysaccharide biosynthesis protein PslH